MADGAADTASGRRPGAGREASGTAVLALLAMLVGLVVWLWPLGVDGRMPVGGDVTQFAMGLMAELGRSLREGRLPLWIDLWGYGFPGVAESQMGVFYPPHLLLYGLLAVETAYTASLVLHTVWGALGAFWAARRFGVSAAGAALAGFVWAASGFFVIHLSHQWGYTVGSWMPWAWGLAWPLVRGVGRPRDAWLLAAVLTLQVLPGHFQLAFLTQVGVGILALWAIVERPEGRTPTLRGVGATLAALVAVLPLGAMQLWPTFRLARLADADRDFAYLSGFAASPLHLVSYVAPGLFQRSPLWRPVAWNPFHTAPEEHLAYVGLAPLFLALGAIGLGWKRDPATRALAILVLATLYLSLGPYVPGFSWLIQLPGFSFFRAPARWGLASALAWAILAGKGFDALRSGAWTRPGRGLVGFALAATAAVALVVLAFELALAATAPPRWPTVVSALDRALGGLPWPDAPTLDQLMDQARRVQSDDARVPSALARGGIAAPSPAQLRLSDSRFAIYAQELGPSALLIAALLAASLLARRRPALVATLVVLTALDLWALGHGDRELDDAPIRPLIEQSAVLSRLAAEPRGTRTLDPLGNLPMAAGASPVLAYRTLDLPALPGLGLLAAHGSLADPTTREALRATGAGLRLIGPASPSDLTRAAHPGGSVELIDDPTLTGWVRGRPWVELSEARATRFALWRPDEPPARAWFVPFSGGRSEAEIFAISGDPARVLELLGPATPLPARAISPEQVEITLPDSDDWGLVILSQLYHPHWTAEWVGPHPDAGPVAVWKVFASQPGAAGWQAVLAPGPGDWTLRLTFHGHDVYEGLAVSLLAWLAWTLSWLQRLRVS